MKNAYSERVTVICTGVEIIEKHEDVSGHFGQFNIAQGKGPLLVQRIIFRQSSIVIFQRASIDWTHYGS